MPKRVRVGEGYLLAPGEWLPGKQRFQIQTYVGEGAFAAAYRAVAEDGEVCFIKEYFPPSRPSEAKELTRVYGTERDVVRRIGNYELSPRFWDAFQHEGYSYLVTDFIPGPDLESVLASGQKPDVDVLLRWSVCLCHELSFLHSRNVVHHDLKPGNIRLNQDGDPVIVDFSAAHWYRKAGETTETLYGSDSYLAPEYAQRSVEDAEAGKKMDVFAMGRILVELMAGQRLTQEEIDRRHDQLYGQILHSGKLDIAFVRAIFKSVAYDPARRYNSGQELAEEVLPAAPPYGRVRPRAVAFNGSGPSEVMLQCYNVGGGTLSADVAVDADWLDVDITGANPGKSVSFQRNRQAVRVIAHPGRVRGGTAAGRVTITFPDTIVEIPVHLSSGGRGGALQVEPLPLRIQLTGESAGQATLAFTNTTSTPAEIRLQPAAPLVAEPAEFAIPAHGRQEVTVTIPAGSVVDGEQNAEVAWTFADEAQPPIAVQVSAKRSGLLASLTGHFLKK